MDNSTIYLKGYYGYKNLGDEVLFFGLIQWLKKTYPKLKKVILECGDPQRMHDWIEKNSECRQFLQGIDVVFYTPRQGHCKRYAHLIKIIGQGSYQKLFKLFGGGEVMSDEREFPHDGRNYLLLFWREILQKNYAIIGGIGKEHKKATTLLYRLLLGRAQSIYCRESISYQRAKAYNNYVEQIQDFSFAVIDHYSHIKKHTPQKSYILINTSGKYTKSDAKKNILAFRKEYPHATPIFFPCDIHDDGKEYAKIQAYIPELQMYNWTQHPLSKTLEYIAGAEAGIASRLHLLLFLNYYKIPRTNISRAEKIQKMLG